MDFVFDCPHFKPLRIAIDENIGTADPKIFPSAVKRGIAPAMSHGTGQTFWGVPIEQLADICDESLAKGIGVREPPTCSEDAAILSKAHHLTTSARQLFAFIRGGHGHGEMPSFPEAIEGPPTGETECLY